MTDVARRPSLSDPKLYINRELSWLGFNDRVLEQAKQERHPLLERVRFVAISETNLDEFFMIRVAGLQQQVASELPNPVPDGMTPEEQLARIKEMTDEFFEERRRILNRELIPALEAEGIKIIPHGKVRAAEKRELRAKFVRDILPILTPLAIDPAHPFPHISNLSLNLLVVIEEEGRRVMARVKMPTTIDRFVRLPDAERGPDERPELRFVRVEEIIAANLDELFPGKEISASYVFQVTRNADFVIEEDEASDLLQAIEDELEGRWFGHSVRLVVSDEMPEDLVEWLAGNLKVRGDAVFAAPHPIGLADLEELTHLDRSDLLYPPISPRIPQEMRNARSITQAIRNGDILLYHPFDSFTPIVDFVRAAANDPEVLAIKQTLYRVGSNSPIVEALSEARDEQTQVATLVELKARFEEEPNITWARQLEARGVHVAYGIVGLKTHAKISLVVRREGHGLRRYVHLGTGNYNPSTARIYTDFSYFTDDEKLAEDGSDIFNYLTGYSDHVEYQELLVAREGAQRRTGPHHLQDELPDRPPDHRAALRGLPGRREDRPHSAQHLLPEARRRGGEREHPGRLPGRALPRARPHLRLRRGRRQDVPGQCRPDAAQPRPPRRDGLPPPRETPPRQGPPPPRPPARRQHERLDPQGRRRVRAPPARGGRRTPRQPRDTPRGRVLIGSLRLK
jgi:polyphosphate kinase